MPSLTSRQEKIQEKRKQTSFRDCIREVASWKPLNIYNINGMLSRYPDTNRKGNIVDNPLISMDNDNTGVYSGNFFQDFELFYQKSNKPALVHSYENENVKYTDTSYGAKNCYLTFNC
jgi:hypothetical protein